MTSADFRRWMCGSEKEQHTGWSVCLDMEPSGYGALQDDMQGFSWDMCWIIEPMLRKSLWIRMENKKNLRSSVSRVSDLKPGIHVYLTALLRLQINFTLIEDLTSSIQIHHLFHCSEEGWLHHLHFYQLRSWSLQMLLSKDTTIK